MNLHRCLLPVLCLLLGATVADAQPRVYVTNERSGDVSVIDTGSDRVVSTINVGKRPRGIRIRGDGKVAYVALSGSPIAPPGVDERTLPPADKSAGGIGVIDVDSGTLRERIESGSDPKDFSLGKDEQFLYASNEHEAKVSIIDLRNRKVVAQLDVGPEPEGVATSPDGKWVYVTCEGTNEVYVIDTEKRAIATRFKTGARPRQIAFHPKAPRAYVTCEDGSCVSVADVTQHKEIKQIRPAGKPIRPMGIVLSPDGNRAYVTTGRSKSVLVIGTGDNEIIGTVEDVGARPWGIGITPDGKTLYTANGPSNDVSVIDVETLAVTKRISAGKSPWGVAASRE
ncbi:MAG TPA: beta-propeller fold lactonase family protein [Tepidisphaeraceae bacterium]|nr:beta-propeller fold lactonase family protein [Tepidisphaeraceae bacterium]